MASKVIICVLIVTALVHGIVEAQNLFPVVSFSPIRPHEQPSENLTSEKHEPTRVQIFTNTLFDLVMDSPKLLQVFDVTTPSLQASKTIFQVYRDSLRRVGASYPDSLAKEFSDAVYLTLPFMQKDIYIRIIGRSLAFYMISQNFLTFENVVLLSQEFGDHILKNVPVSDADDAAIVAALPIGIMDFLTAHGSLLLKHLPLYSMSTTMYFYAFTVVSKPQWTTSVVDPTGSIIDAAKISGMDRFAFTFSKNVNSLAVFQQVFYLNEPIPVISKSWKLAMVSFCGSVNCTFPYATYFEKIVNLTYPYVSKNTYVNIIANAYSLTLIGLGSLSSENTDSQANTVTNLIENFINKLPPNANLVTRLGVIFSALQSILPLGSDVGTLYGCFASYIALGLHAVTPIAATFPSN